MALPDLLEDLIYRFLMKETSEEETARLKSMLSENPEYLHEFQQFCRIWHYGKYTGEWDQIGLEEAWQKIEKRKPVSRLSKWRYGAVAASFILLVAISGYFLFRNPEQTPPLTVEIKPGSAKAQLVLASGKKINLGKYPPLEIAESGMIIAGDTAMLMYQKGTWPEDTIEKYNELTIPRGGEYRLCLCDGTMVYLNSESKLKYPVTFSGKERRVWLEGEAYFEVTGMPDKPFIVSSAGIDVTVLGTKFNVTSYSESGQVTTTLVKGCVEVKAAGYPGGQSRLCPGEQAVFDKVSGKLMTREVNVLLYTSWKDGYYTFEQQPIGEIMQTLSRWYDLEVVFENPGLRDIRFTGRLKRYEDISEILSMFQLTQGIRCVSEGKKVMIQK